MVTNAAYKIIKKAAIIRVKRGEEVQDVIDSYPKLSDKQRAQLYIDLTTEA